MKPKSKPTPNETVTAKQETEKPASPYIKKHLKWGWWSLLFFLGMGLFLEILHGFKVSAYLDASNSTRRLMWTLAHAHGTLLALVHIAFALTIPHLRLENEKSPKTISMCLIGAGILMPGGFFLGGAVTYGGDPGLGIFLLPVGAFMLFIGVFATANRIAQQ